MKVEEYYVVEANEWAEFVNEVNYKINQGWIPIGGVSKVLDSQDEVSYLQAMVSPTK